LISARTRLTYRVPKEGGLVVSRAPPLSDLENKTEFTPVQGERAQAERFVDSILPPNRVLKVLDIKAGDQRFEIRRPIYVVGVDVLQAERGRRPDADEHRVMDLERVELESTEYDVVLCINVLEHARNPLALFPVIREALKPDGIFVIELPNVVTRRSDRRGHRNHRDPYEDPCALTASTLSIGGGTGQRLHRSRSAGYSRARRSSLRFRHALE